MPLFQLKRIAILLTALTALNMTPVRGMDGEGWTLEMVLRRVEGVNGGIGAIASTSDLRVSGRITWGEETISFLLVRKRPDKVRIRLTGNRYSVETGFNGETAWRRFRVKDSVQVEELSIQEFRDLEIDPDFDGPLLGPPRADQVRRLEGVERVGRVDYFVIVLESETEKTRHYIDTRTFRESMSIRETPVNGKGDTRIQTQYRDYSRYNGIWLAREVERILPDGRRETYRLEHAEFDCGLLDLVFDKPAT